MRKTTIISALVIILSSCATSFYQLYKVESVFESVGENDQLIYEDENCKISYQIWSQGGDIGFDFHNKTAENIEVNLKKSFFIVNGNAYDYFKNRIYTSSKSSGIMATNNYLKTASINTGISVSTEEDSIIVIPSGAAKRISEYSISNEVYRSCDLLRYPLGKKNQTIQFDSATSPLIFSNRIYYSKSDISMEVRNEFFVSEITNYPSNEFFEYRQDEICGKKSLSSTKAFKYESYNSFYLMYLKTGSISQY